MSVIDTEEEAKAICTRLYYGYVEKEEFEMLAKDELLYRSVKDKLDWIGLELVDRPECPWYVAKVKREYDSFTQFRSRNKSLKSIHLALILILYAKLVLPKRVGQVDNNEVLSISFEEIYEKFGHKFAPSSKVPTSKQRMEKLLSMLATQGFILKKRAAYNYVAGPSMYMLHEDLLTDLAKSSLETLFGFVNHESESMN